MRMTEPTQSRSLYNAVSSSCDPDFLTVSRCWTKESIPLGNHFGRILEPFCPQILEVTESIGEAEALCHTILISSNRSKSRAFRATNSLSTSLRSQDQNGGTQVDDKPHKNKALSASRRD